MEEIILDLLKIVNTIIAGVPLDFGSIANDKRRDALILALHCCLNGPVGVNKDTTFPVVGPKKIKDFLGVTNSSWKGFCHQVALIVTNADPKINCNQLRLKGKYWPL